MGSPYCWCSAVMCWLVCRSDSALHLKSMRIMWRCCSEATFRTAAVSSHSARVFSENRLKFSWLRALATKWGETLTLSDLICTTLLSLSPLLPCEDSLFFCSVCVLLSIRHSADGTIRLSRSVIFFYGGAFRSPVFLSGMIYSVTILYKHCSCPIKCTMFSNVLQQS